MTFTRCFSLHGLLTAGVLLTMTGCDQPGAADKPVAGKDKPAAAKTAVPTAGETSPTAGKDKPADSDKVAASEPSPTKPGTTEPDATMPDKSKSKYRVKPKTSGETTVPVQVVEDAPPPDEEELGPAKMPTVTLSAGHAATCKVKVGDAMPEIKLPDTTGSAQNLSTLRGPKLTVVVVWSADHPFAIEELADLTPDVAARYGSRGVKILGIGVGEDAEHIQRQVEKAGAKFPNLVDAQGEAFKLLADGHLPRTYLLDSQGKILWMDLEYSRTTRRELRQAIRAALQGSPAI